MNIKPSSVAKEPYCGDHAKPINNRSCEVKLENYIPKLKYLLYVSIS